MRTVASIAGTCLTLLLLSSPSLAQQGQIRGAVVDSAGTPVPAATVQIPELEMGTITGENGRFEFEVEVGTYRVVASRVGRTEAERTVTVQAGQTTTLEFVLAEAAVQVQDVVVSLAATPDISEAIGTSIGNISASEAVETGAVTNFSELINARSPGVSLELGSGEVGTASRIRVRGPTSLTQDNNPIVFIDGVRASSNTSSGPGSVDFGDGQTISRLDDIDPNSIERIQIRKGPAAAAAYGSEAASGVLIIETKDGNADQQTVRVAVEQGAANDVTQYPNNFFNLTRNFGITDLNNETIQQWDPIENSVTGDIFARHNPLENPRTEPFRTGWAQDYSASLSGGAPQVTYFLTGRYENRKGSLPNNDLERGSARLNASVSPSDIIQISGNTSFILSDVRYNGSGRSALGYITNGAAGLPGFSYGTMPDGSRGDCLISTFSGAPSSLCEARQGNLTANFNELGTIVNSQEVGRFLGGVTAQIEPFDWWSNRVATGIDYIQQRDQNFIPLDPERPFGTESEGFRVDNRTTSQIITFDAASTASFGLPGDLRARSTFGAQYFRTADDVVGCEAQNFASNSAIACDAALTFSSSSNFVEIVEMGAYTQQRLSFREYLHVTGALRIDDNSAFGRAQDAIWSPSVNGSAILSRMPFWNLDAVNHLRLRMAWGKAAQAPEPYAADRTLRPVRLTSAGGQISGLSLQDPGNPDLTAERNEEFEAGLTAGLFSDRLRFDFTYFSQETSGAIVSTNVAPSSGFAGDKFVNIGAVSNSGVEASLDALIMDNSTVNWHVRASASTQDPIVKSLGDQPPILLGAQVDGMFHEGLPPGAYYGPVVSSAQRADDGSIVPGSIEFAPGNLDIPGRPNYQFLGDPNPSNFQSLSTTATFFERLSVSTVVERVAGHRKMNDTRGTRTPFIEGISGSRQFAMRQEESTPEQQAAMELDLADAGQVFIDDADFIKIRELTAQYRFLRDGERFGPLNSTSLTIGVRNVATVTDYFGFDPEGSVGGGSDNFTTGDFFNQPPNRYWFTRLAITF